MDQHHLWKQNTSHAGDLQFSGVAGGGSVTKLCPTAGLWPARLLCPRDFSGKKTEVGCHFLLQDHSQPRDRTQVSILQVVSCTVGRFFTD